MYKNIFYSKEETLPVDIIIFLFQNDSKGIVLF